MREPPWAAVLARLEARSLGGGGFRHRDGGSFRPDATAWAILALEAMGAAPSLVEAGRARLAALQGQDGRVSLAPDHPEAFWPTPLAILAWQGSPAQAEARQRAVSFLLAATGRHWQSPPDATVGHDVSLRGWPWRADTHSWVEPTALGLIALMAAGQGEHPRAAEARRLLLNRQLPGGGWNYGNTVVFGQVLHPMPESTGMALQALAGGAARPAVQPSLDYLTPLTPRLTTPRTLAWALLGLGAWGLRPAAAGAWLSACLARQDEFGGFDTVSLAMLLLASRAAAGLLGVLAS